MGEYGVLVLVLEVEDEVTGMICVCTGYRTQGAQGEEKMRQNNLTRKDRGHTVNMDYAASVLGDAIWLLPAPIRAFPYAGIHVIPAWPHQTKRSAILWSTI